MNAELRYNIKASVATSVANARNFFPNDNDAIRSKAVNVLYAVAIGCRAIKPEIIAMGSDLVEPHKVDYTAVKVVVSDLGETLFFNHTDVLAIANTIYDYRYQVVVSPEQALESISIKQFIESKVPGTSDYIAANFSRVLNTVNSFFDGVAKDA